VEALRPSLIVELGTHSGNSYNAFCQAVEMTGLSTRCFAVDTWEGDVHAGAYDSSIYDKLATYQKSTYAKFSSLLRMTFDDALSRFDDRSIDLLHIDGLHTYEAVKHDFDTWLPKVAPGGVILLHDIAVRENNFGVWKLWDEIKKSFTTAEFSHGYGLGIVFVPGSLTERCTELYNLLTQETSKLLFSSLGRAALLAAEKTRLESTHEVLLQEQEHAKLEIAHLNQVVSSHQNTLRLLGLSHTLFAQLSCDRGEGFKEELTHRQQLTTDGVEFSYRPEASLTDLRGVCLMPINCPARLSNPTVVAVDSQGNETVLNADRSEGISNASDGSLEIHGEFPCLFFSSGLPSTVTAIKARYQLKCAGTSLINLLRKETEVSQSQLFEAKTTLAQLRLTHELVLNSISWRSTAPFRSAASWLRPNTPLVPKGSARARGSTSS
jgi:hypothetical protein